MLRHPTEGHPTNGRVSIGYDEDAFVAAHGGECARLGDWDIRFGDARIGSSWSGDDDVDFGGCLLPSANLDIAQFGRDTLGALRIFDDSHTVEAVFGATALVPHLPTLRSPSTWRFAGGDTVVFGWSHPDDLVTGADFLEHPVYFHTGTLDDPNFFDLDAQLAGDEITFTVPSPPPITGDGYIVARFGYTSGEADSCTGATRCGYQLEAGYAHAVVIER